MLISNTMYSHIKLTGIHQGISTSREWWGLIYLRNDSAIWQDNDSCVSSNLNGYIEDIIIKYNQGELPIIPR